ncbi:MAG: hypothetical protein QXK76_02550 [Candidatus Woesearchaeota archaeon]
MDENQINKYYSMYDDTQQEIEDVYIPNIPKIDFDPDTYTVRRRKTYSQNNKTYSKTYSSNSSSNSGNIVQGQSQSQGQQLNPGNFFHGVTVNGKPAKDYLKELLYPNSNDIYDLANYFDAIALGNFVSSKYCKNVLEAVVTSTVIAYGIFNVKKFIYEKLLK